MSEQQERQISIKHRRAHVNVSLPAHGCSLKSERHGECFDVSGLLGGAVMTWGQMKLHHDGRRCLFNYLEELNSPRGQIYRGHYCTGPSAEGK